VELERRKFLGSLTFPAIYEVKKGAGEGNGKPVKDFTEFIEPDNREIRRIADDTEFHMLGDLEVIFPDFVQFEAVTDQRQYGEDDKWISGPEFIERDFRGDCEDYSAFCTSVFLAMDVPARSLWDSGEEGKMGHVATEVRYGDEYWITDTEDPGVFYSRPEYNSMEEWNFEKMIDDTTVEVYREDW
jgi:hypothetical protein